MTTVLKVDIDYKAPETWLLWWEATRRVILKHLGFTFKRISRHNTTKGQNYFIEIEEKVSPQVTNMLQFMLGDDHTRCKINAWRIERGVPHWNKIFDRKLWRKGAKMIECWYCGNKIPLISHEPLGNGEEVDATEEKEKTFEEAKAEEEAKAVKRDEEAAAGAEVEPEEEPKEEPEAEPEGEPEEEPKEEPEAEPEGEPEEEPKEPE